MATSSSASAGATAAAQRLSQQQPSPTSQSSYRRASRNTTESSGYGLLEDESGEAERGHPLSSMGGGKGKGKQREEDVGGYAEGGGDLGVEEMMSEGERERRRELKGKGRMQVDSAVDDEDVDEVPPQFPLEQEDEDAREEQRIAENLARWSKAESTRRKSLRNSSTLVLRSAPPLPSPSTLARRSSALIRAGSKRLSRIPTGRDSEEMALTSPVKKGESRRSQRRGSVKLEDQNAEVGSAMLPPAAPNRMEHLIEGDEQSIVTTPPASIVSNPFTSPPSSASARSTSFDTSSTIDARHHSLFIEDLPLQSPSLSPTKPKPSSLNTTSLGSTRSSLDSPSPSPSPIGSTRNPSPMKENDSILSLESQDTIVPTGGTSRDLGGGGGVRSSAEYEGRMYRGIGEYATGEGGQEDEERNDERGAGFLDWLLCGCFRSREGDEQAGRTNPNE
ncbi:hypothetical protein BCR35DRAFT_308961 [Leucosporidium creatinivorum]|uniref:Uncharacterized protein n=1 Tax=Leucosporidium creatinivorum TaxID=106004 RepID=A0A1Y2DTW8_9BASI|nr:hypothetical protein BCR35DRAFT_308961 [Leucosporidium creatinivorum]